MYVYTMYIYVYITSPCGFARIPGNVELCLLRYMLYVLGFFTSTAVHLVQGHSGRRVALRGVAACDISHCSVDKAADEVEYTHEVGIVE